MQKLNYQSPARAAAIEPLAPKEMVIPVVLLTVGFLLYGIAAFRGSPASAGVVLLAIGVVLAIQTALGIGSAYLVAHLMGSSFGELRTAFLKMAGILTFAGALSNLIPMGWALSLFIYLGLLMWLFDLEVYEAVVFAVAFSIVRLIVAIFIFALFFV